MMRKSVEFNIGIADSEFISSKRDLEFFEVTLRTWNNKIARIRFEEPIAICDRLITDYSDLIENDESTPFLSAALLNNDETVSDEFPFKEFAFLNLDGTETLNVVAKGVTMIIEDADSP